MPPRWVCLVIVVCWLATGGWLFRHHLWPSLEPDAPPPFTIDLTDEAQTKQAPVLWRVECNGRAILSGQSWVEHRARENDFVLHAVLRPASGRDGSLTPPLRLRRLAGSYRVTREGELLGLSCEMALDLGGGAFDEDRPPDSTAHVWGEVRDGRFEPHCEVTLPSGSGGKRNVSLKPVAVSARGAVLMPLHPVNKISGLRPGQRWRVPLCDPVGDALGDLVGGRGGTRDLRAAVLPEPRALRWLHRDVPCLVIEYEEIGPLPDGRLNARTWVSVADDRVLRQEAQLDGARWVMERE